MSRNGYKSLTADVDARDDLISPLRRVVESTLAMVPCSEKIQQQTPRLSRGSSNRTENSTSKPHSEITNSRYTEGKKGTSSCPKTLENVWSVERVINR